MRSQKRFFLILLFVCIIFSTVSCKESKTEVSSEDDDKKVIAVTIIPQQGFVKAICKDRVKVITVVQPGSSPETYEPSPTQITELNKADIYFKIGVPVENTKAFPLLENTVMINLAKEVSAQYPDLMFEENERDHHIWLSLKRVIVMINVMAREISKIDPENKDFYTENAAAFIKEIEQTDKYAKGMFADVKGNKTFLTFHPAYAYFADEYGLTMYSLEQEGREATAQDLVDIISFAKEHNIKVMFAQAESASKQPAAFASEVGGKVVLLNPLDEDYIKNIKYMAEQISEALKSE